MFETPEDAVSTLSRAWPVIIEECRAVPGGELHYQAVVYHCLRMVEPSRGAWRELWPGAGAGRGGLAQCAKDAERARLMATALEILVAGGLSPSPFFHCGAWRWRCSLCAVTNREEL